MSEEDFKEIPLDLFKNILEESKIDQKDSKIFLTGFAAACNVIREKYPENQELINYLDKLNLAETVFIVQQKISQPAKDMLDFHGFDENY